MTMHQQYVRTLQMMGRSVAVALLVCSGVQLHAQTIAHWDFETDLLAGTVVDGQTVSHPSDNGVFDAAIQDISGNGNHLSAFTGAGGFGEMQFSNNVSGSNQTGSLFSTQNIGSYAGLTSDLDLDVGGTAVANLATWSVEASVNFKAVGGHQTLIGKDGTGQETAEGGDLGRAPLYLQKTDADVFSIKYVDVAGNSHDIFGTTVASVGSWYNVAATSDGSTLKLYVNGFEEGSLDLTGSADSAMVALDESGTEGDGGTVPYAWSIARGMYGNGHGDRLNGYLDDVRISSAALGVNDLLNGMIDSLSLVVNTLDGSVSIRNDTNSPLAFDYYRIDSPTDGSLLTTWNSLSDQGVDAVDGGDDLGETWEEASGVISANLLVEQFLLGNTSLAAGEQISLGTAFDYSIAGAENDGDLEFSFAGVDGTLTRGRVIYTTSAGILGDYNGNGIVDAADYTLWRDSFNSTTNLAADGDGDGVIDQDDYDVWVNNFGTTSSNSSAVPEPASVLLTLLGVGSLLVARRR